MATVRPFRAYRPTANQAAEVASVPYDVVNTEEARKLAGGKPNSFLRVVRSEIDLPAGTDPYSPEVYQQAKQTFDRLIASGVLVQDEEESFYVYQQQMGDHVQTGIVGCSAVDDYDSGVIKLHEKTRPEKENDRTTHMVTIGAHPGPVFLAYKAVPEIKQLTAEVMASTPLLAEVVAEDGVIHRVWRAAKNAELQSAFAQIGHTYVADGHHRAASASRCRAEMRSRNPQHSGEEAYNFFLSVLFPHDELQILPYNRVIKKLAAAKERVLAAIGEVYRVSPTDEPQPRRKGDVCLYLDKQWHLLSPPAGETPPADPVAALDVSVLHEKVLGPILGIGDARTDKNIDFIGGARGTEELERLVDGGDAACAFSMFPVSIEELFAVADCGAMMAPKSTWFEPKLRSGLLVHVFR